ncbi:MAG: ammonium transporter, partial [Planctomycetota bacterium]
MNALSRWLLPALVVVFLSSSARLSGQEADSTVAAEVTTSAEAVSSAASATEAASQIQTNLDYVWILIATALVFMMQAGFMCLESGMCRAKNSINVAVKNMADFVLSVSVYWLWGFGIMFGASYMGLFGTSDFLVSVGDDPWLPVFFVFQAVFCGTAATIDSGALAERTSFKAYLAISFVISVLVYPVFGHWAWGSFYNGETQGWLESLGFIDFAGSTVVHSLGGWIALAGLIAVGPRTGKFDQHGHPRRIQPHSLIMVYLGTFILCFGWLGFNCGSTLAATTDIAGIAMNTILAACFGALSAAIVSWFGPTKRPEPDLIANGLLGGLVGVTAGCACVSTFGAAMIGLTSGALVLFAMRFIEETLKLDDVVGAVAVHGVAGAWGTLCVAFFILPQHLPEGVTWIGQLGTQSIGVGVCFLWSFGCGYLVLNIVKIFTPLRVTEEEEAVGLNVAEHGATSSVIDLANAMHKATTNSDYSDSNKVEAEFGTEIGDLARSYNDMVDSIQRDKLQLTAAAAEQQKLTQEMSASYGQLEDAERKILANKEALRVEAERAACESTSIASEGEETIRRSMESIQEIEKSTSEIEGALNLVSNISEQTNMLALNASIEAARAGSAGKGFAVVADEVRNLASETRSAASHIGDLMKNTENLVREGTKHGQETAQVFDRIIESNNRNAERIAEIAS